jgi:hypothetical protein
VGQEEEEREGLAQTRVEVGKLNLSKVLGQFSDGNHKVNVIHFLYYYLFTL